MFIAMNRFRVAKGSEAAFEQVWISRDTHLEAVPGFLEFHLLKGPELEDHTLYTSHPVWENRLCSMVGPNRRRSGLRTVRQGTTSDCIWITRSSRASRSDRGSNGQGAVKLYLVPFLRQAAMELSLSRRPPSML